MEGPAGGVGDVGDVVSTAALNSVVLLTENHDTVTSQTTSIYFIMKKKMDSHVLLL